MDRTWQKYKEFILLYFIIIFAIFGAFCFGMWLIAPSAH